MAPGGTKEELTKVEDATGNVAADEVGVHGLKVRGSENAASENAIAKTRGEALDLRFEGVEHVHGGAVGNVAVGPGGVLPSRGARGIEETGLREEDEGAVGMAAVADGVFGGGNFFGASAEMHGGGAETVLRSPGDGRMQGVIDFENTGAVAVFREAARKSEGQAVSGDAQELVRG